MPEERTPEELAQQREDSLAYLNDPVIKGLAIAYLVENKEDEGEADRKAIHDFKYIPSIRSESAQNMILQDFMQSRNDGRRYTGTASEYSIINRAAGMFEGSIKDVYVKDLVELTGSDIDVADEYQNKYMFELLDSENEEEKETGKRIAGAFMGYFVNSEVSDARDRLAAVNRTALEQIVGPAEDAE